MKKILVLCASLLVFSGCMTTSVKSDVRPERAVFLDASKLGGGKKIYLSVKNTSKCGADIASMASGKLASKGYEITHDAAAADFVVQAQVLYCDHKRENNKIGGALLGAGAALGIASHNHAGGWAKVGWSALGAIIGGGLAHLGEDDTWDLQVALHITPKGEQPQDTTIFARASKMNLSGNEASNVLENDIANQIAEIF